jgi:hypothetical protein
MFLLKALFYTLWSDHRGPAEPFGYRTLYFVSWRDPNAEVKEEVDHGVQTTQYKQSLMRVWRARFVCLFVVAFESRELRL